MGQHTLFITWLWEKTPGNTWAKTTIWLIATMVVLYALFGHIYPWVFDTYMSI